VPAAGTSAAASTVPTSAEASPAVSKTSNYLASWPFDFNRLNMKIFIDESGRFIPGDGWSVVCALSLPHQFCGPARREIQRISKNWVKVDGEIKGSFVTVDQLAALVDCLFRYDALLHCCACDVSRHDRSAIVEHQTDQAKGITRYLVPTHHPEMVAKVWSLRRAVERMPSQLYVQSVLMRELKLAVFWIR
jgi:hypothetical protein